MSSKNSPILFNKPTDGNFWLTNFATGFPIVAKLPTKITASGEIATDSGFIEIDGKKKFTWLTSEHLFQALKFTRDNIDIDLIKKIIKAAKPDEARKLGKPIGRRDWIDPTNYRLNVMKWVLRQKFTQHPKLKTMLIETDDALLVEDAGARDKFWGNGEIDNGKSGFVDKSKGQNMLGELLMDLRKKFQVETGKSKIANPNSSPPLSSESQKEIKKPNSSQLHFNTDQTFSLYEFIKQTSQAKGRPLKIIADWDDCLQPVRPLVIYYNTSPQLTSSFEEFAERFYANSILSAFSSNKSEIGEYQGYPEEKQAVELFEKKRFEEPEKNDYKGIEGFYEKNNFYSSLGKDLLLALNQGLIEKLILISSCRKDKGKGKGGWFFVNRDADIVVKEKINKWKKTFGQFPHTEFSITKKIKGQPHRLEVIRNNFPDFDIFIDDDPNIIKEASQGIAGKKFYVMPDYKINRHVQGDNIFRVKTKIVKLTDDNFAKFAEEYQAKQANKIRKPAEPENQSQVSNIIQPVNNSSQPKNDNSGKIFLWIGSVFLLVFLGGIIYWLKKKNH